MPRGPKTRSSLPRPTEEALPPATRVDNQLKVLAADVGQTRSSEPILHGLKRLLIVRATIEVHLSVRPIGLGW